MFVDQFDENVFESKMQKTLKAIFMTEITQIGFSFPGKNRVKPNLGEMQFFGLCPDHMVYLYEAFNWVSLTTIFYTFTGLYFKN